VACPVLCVPFMKELAAKDLQQEAASV